MQERHSGEGAEIAWTPEMLEEVRAVVLSCPSAGGFKPFALGISPTGRLQLVATNLQPGYAKYGETDYKRLLQLEAGGIAYAISLYMETKGFHSRNRYFNTQVTNGTWLVTQLSIHAK
jgi:hypothetical protein